ncbi:PREDICTED: uncharacterized protein LOC104592322 [Nelumbo nucifera]|uniref:RING-type E3 ubiquitin transferase n=1 Tax=Nelumbo nucifera TaxID=4432 RepID=A0A1U7ZB95_NELNU|nr:PREDICTED: uncharacterized protein LOC104592322 [Nelumbo nucifera]XP_010249932.1 PREDICTED: uncharacterized protein LOC104592322 [Nelumbo nucifera]
MRIPSSDLYIWILLGLLVFFSFSFTDSYVTPFDGAVSVGEPSVTYKYDRLDEVKRECKSIISSASELKPDDNRVYTIRNELSFLNGDWAQQEDGSPIIPFDDRDMPKSSADLISPLKLISFWVMDVNPVRTSKYTIAVSGLLFFGITRNGSFAYKPYLQGSPDFQMWPGHSQLAVSFQGVYTESEGKGGERVMCLLGTSMLPSRQPDSTDPWEWAKASGPYAYQPSFLQDDQILLVLHYPKTLTLSSRAIYGEMKSLNKKSSIKYFDTIHISSQLGPYANYEFGSEELISKTCNPYPYPDNLMDDGTDVYKGSDFCGILQRFTSREAFSVVPNWKCNNADEYCRKLGPFMSVKEINATDGGFKNVRLLMQDVRCEAQGNGSSARVSAVFRAVPPFENQFTAVERTGLSNMTLSAEGIWSSSSGQLCMIGCIGVVGKSVDRCDSRICAYAPLVFSVKQRNAILGSISSINNRTGSYFPLSFEKIMQPSDLWDQFSTSHLSYKYSKIKLAGAFLERSEPFNLGSVIKKSFLKFPSLQDSESFLVSLSLLSEDLTLHVSAVPDPLSNLHPLRTTVQVDILSLGPLFGRYWPSQNYSTAGTEDFPFHAKAESTERQMLLNVSAQLILDGKLYSNASLLFLEGLYDPHFGKMYLIGCRDVRASWKILFESHDLEAGLDCSIEVKIEYPPTTALWLINPTAKISIASQRTEDDPLYFGPINLQTLPILYRKQREDILSRRGVEGILRILTLSLAIACILSQLIYIRDKVDAVPYISLVMLGVQALGYSIPLITGAEALFKRMASEEYEKPSYDLDKNQWFHVIDYTVKLLVLVAFLLTLRLGQKVWKSRIRLLTRTPLEPRRVPSDKRVLFTSLVIHTIGFIIVLTVHAFNASQRPFRQQKYIDPSGNAHTLWEWETKLEEYVGLVQDFFLLPQIIGNFLWQIHCKPLRKVYYIGVTIVRLLPHVYDYIRTPVFNPYFSEEYEFVNPSLDFYSKFGDIAIPVTAVLLAIVVYIQQRWSYEKLSQTLNSGQCKLLPLGSRVYERLPSKSFEAELALGVNESVEPERDQKDEE